MTSTPTDNSALIVGLIDGAPAGGVQPPPSPMMEEYGFDDEFPDEAPPADTDWALVERCAAEPQNDIGNSRRLRHRAGADLLHVQNIGWHVYDAQRWKEDIDDVGTRPVCHAVVEAIAYEAHVLKPTPREQEAIEAGDAAKRDVAAYERELASLKASEKDADTRRRADALRESLEEAKDAVDRGREARKAFAQRQAQRKRFANTSGNKGKLDGMLSEAIPFLSRPIGDLDADQLAYNVANGTLRFVQVEMPDPECPDPDEVRMVTQWTVERRDHAREDLISKLSDIEYDEAAESPIFDKFLATILPEAEMRAFVQRYFGYSLTALTREQCFLLFHGEGRNGKSTLVDIIGKIMGDYSTTIPIDSLVNSGAQKKGSEATPDLARLPGARLVRTAEPKEGAGFDESLIKQLTAGEPILVRRLNAEFIEVYPTFKLVISANRKPDIKGNDDGIWRRVVLVPFDVQIAKEDVDKQLGDKMWAERAGILNWLVAGAIDYLTRGQLDPPKEVIEATQEYREESDLMGMFARAALEVTKDPADVVETGHLYRVFEVFCRRTGRTPFAQNTFTRRLPKTASQHGFEKGKSSVSVCTGIRVRPEFAPPPPPLGG
ncbi:DNA primase family protein [Methylobacterium frigidaeris]|uniref:SF3 helicase domain-containing protein n=1 Tax=Methylobacterium frigidaeris TaxID=2038277 RepID=A0AA37HHA8_9HYPH|nr:phage/plasmid primase, P4 family [Methylobacterium frigidaeris]PIK74595.1 hypothetical protein CS379_01735 [Methylobacterium frigidaeris]GJD65160.1 hypothetical protein MPEAHAMD_5347 [Methylobacterium frigidaeris]